MPKFKIDWRWIKKTSESIKLVFCSKSIPTILREISTERSVASAKSKYEKKIILATLVRDPYDLDTIKWKECCVFINQKAIGCWQQHSSFFIIYLKTYSL